MDDTSSTMAPDAWSGGSFYYVSWSWATYPHFAVKGCLVVYERFGVSGWGLPPPRSLPTFYIQLILFHNVPVHVLSWLQNFPQRSTPQRNPIYNRERRKRNKETRVEWGDRTSGILKMGCWPLTVRGLYHSITAIRPFHTIQKRRVCQNVDNGMRIEVHNGSTCSRRNQQVGEEHEKK